MQPARTASSGNRGGRPDGAARARRHQLAAAVPFYGGQPPAAEVAKIKAPLLIHYAALDERIDAGWPAFEAALKANSVRYEMFMYPNTQHGFHNDTTPRYDEAAAKLARRRSRHWLDSALAVLALLCAAHYAWHNGRLASRMAMVDDPLAIDVAVSVVFVALLAAEWFLRRRWGMV